MTGAKGRIEANSVNADVEVRHRSTGEISTETVNGSIELEGTDATTLTATSVNGDLATTARCTRGAVTRSPPTMATSRWS